MTHGWCGVIRGRRIAFHMCDMIMTSHVWHDDDLIHQTSQCVAVCCSVMHCVAVCCSVLQCVAVRCSPVCCSDTMMISYIERVMSHEWLHSTPPVSHSCVRHDSFAWHLFGGVSRVTCYTRDFPLIFCSLYSWYLYVRQSWFTCETRLILSLWHGIWQFPRKILPPPDSPNPKTQVPRFTSKLNQNLNLNLYREIPRNLSFSMWWIFGGSNCSGNCCIMLQCVAVCCSALQCVAVCCSVLQCVAVCYNVSQCVAVCCSELQCVVLLCVAVTWWWSRTSNECCLTHEWVMSHTWMSHVSLMNEPGPTCE